MRGIITDVENYERQNPNSALYDGHYASGEMLARIFDLRAVKLGDGIALAWRDVTDRVKMEMTEHEQRILIINDTHGHMVGDLVLKNLVKRCRSNIREIDILGRYRGE